jgi:hypothetical protein
VRYYKGKRTLTDFLPSNRALQLGEQHYSYISQISNRNPEMVYSKVLNKTSVQYFEFCRRTMSTGRSQWLRGPKREMISPAQTLGLWVRIPLEARTSVRVSSVLSCPMQVASFRRTDPPSKESYQLSVMNE